MRIPTLAVASAIASTFFATTPAVATDKTTTGTTAANQPVLADVVVITRRLDEARNGLSPETGSSIYRLDAVDINSLPLGDSTPINQVILQVPGVVQDSYGQLHVRGDHANLQYRINGVVIPEAISGFGQSLDTRFAERINILTGALPAQYGYRTAGVVDIHTKGYSPEQGGSIDLTGGSYNHRELGGDVSGSAGAFSYYGIASYLHNSLGIENPTSARDAIHDDTNQAKGFGYLSYVLNDASRLNFMFGVTNNRFQIPNVPGQTPDFSLNGMTTLDSSLLDANQQERNRFAILSYQGKAGDADYQVSVFHRYTDVNYRPDAIGDLMFNGVAAQILRTDKEIGVQADISDRLNENHTVRAGLFFNHEQFDSNNVSQVFPADADGNQTSDAPLTIADTTAISGHTAGVYIQDEWRPFDKLTINYGARFDRVSTVVDEHQFSPRLGIVYDVTSTLRVHAGYARYFTPPPTEKIDTTSVEKFLGTTNALPSDANTAVSSERSHYFDVGISQQLTDKFTLGLDAYYRKVENLQDEGQFGNALIFSAFNYEEGRVYGTELSTSYRGKRLTAYANVAWSKAEARNIATGQFNFDDDELAYIASNWVHLDHDQTWAGSAGASYKWGSTTLSGDALWGSGLRRGFANSESLPAYAQVNLALIKAFDFSGAGKLEGRLAIINLFDHVYEIRDGSGIGVGAPQFAPRRAVYIGLNKSF